MAQSEKKCTAIQLKRDGFKMAGKCKSLYVSQSGAVFSVVAGKFLKPTERNQVKPETEYLSVPKLVLEAFANEPYRNGHIIHIDGNKENLNVENLKYTRIFPTDRKPDPVNREHLLLVIRCYVRVNESYNVKDSFQTGIYLKMITGRRLFFELNKELKHIDVFQSYINGDNASKTAKKYGLTALDRAVIINMFINMLITEILKDIENGIIQILPYKPKLKTATQQIREYNKELIERGAKPLPLRKKSVNQKIKEYKNMLNNQREQLPKTDVT